MATVFQQMSYLMFEKIWVVNWEWLTLNGFFCTVTVIVDNRRAYNVVCIFRVK